MSGFVEKTPDGAAEEARRRVARRLRRRRAELEEGVMARLYQVLPPSGIENPEYLQGLERAVSDALTYAFEALELPEEQFLAPPETLLTHVQSAARQDIPLNAVLRRCVSGYMLLTASVFQEAEAEAARTGISLRRMLHGRSAHFEPLISTVSETYEQELAGRPPSSKQRLAETVRRLLNGEILEHRDLAYDFEHWHTALVVEGKVAAAEIESLAAAVDRRLLRVEPDEETTWAWLGGRERLESKNLMATIPAWTVPVTAIGEPGFGLDGWRFTHRQAMRALPFARRAGDGPVVYADVPLTAAALEDELLSLSLKTLYLAPFAGERDGGAALKATARAYLDAAQHVTSAAAALGVSRQTVAARIRTIEERLERPLESCSSELDIALRLEQLESPHYSARSH